MPVASRVRDARSPRLTCTGFTGRFSPTKSRLIMRWWKPLKHFSGKTRCSDDSFDHDDGV